MRHAHLDHAHLGVLAAAAEEARRLDAEVANLRKTAECAPRLNNPAERHTFSTRPSITAVVYFSSALSRSALAAFFSCATGQTPPMQPRRAECTRLVGEQLLLLALRHVPVVDVCEVAL